MEDKKPTDKQLATYGNNCLLSRRDFHTIVINAKNGDIESKAALALMANSGLILTEKGFPTISSERALKAVQNGVEPPYDIPYEYFIVESNNSSVYQHTTIHIDESYNVQYLNTQLIVREKDFDETQCTSDDVDDLLENF